MFQEVGPAAAPRPPAVTGVPKMEGAHMRSRLHGLPRMRARVIFVGEDVCGRSGDTLARRARGARAGLLCAQSPVYLLNDYLQCSGITSQADPDARPARAWPAARDPARSDL